MADEKETEVSEGQDSVGETPDAAAETPDAADATPDLDAAPEAQVDEAVAQAPKRRTRSRKKPQPSKALTLEERRAERHEARRKKAVARRVQRASARTKYRAAEHERQATSPREHIAGVQKTRQGVVVSDRADKTITVRIDMSRRHRRYEKIVRTSNTIHAHDSGNEAHVGDTVIVRECRPLSRTKRWRLVQVIERAK